MIKVSQKLHLTWVLIIAGTILTMLAVGVINAQTDDSPASGNGMRITPIRQEFTLAPGQAESYEIEVTNVSGAPMNIQTLVNDFISDNETGNPKLLTDADEDSKNNPYSLKKYVTLPEPFYLEPEESFKAVIGVDVPTDANPGGYFGVVRFAPTSAGSDEGTIALTASVGSLLLVSVPGEVTENMDLNFLEARYNGESSTVFEYPPQTLAVGLENTGNSILKPFGTVVVKNLFGNEVYSYEFNGGDVRGNVLPQSSRVFESDLENIGRIGRYKVEATVSYGGGGDIIIASTTFWVIPWKLIIFAIVIIGGAFWVSTKGLKIYNRRVVEKAKKKSS